MPSDPPPSLRDPLVGTTLFGKYSVLAALATGNGTRVYRATQAIRDVEVLVKFIDLPGVTAEQFSDSALRVARLSHPHLVSVFDYAGISNDTYALVSEYLDGMTLRRSIRMTGHFTESRALHIVKQIGRGLGDIHRAGMIHGDLTSSNVFLVDAADDPDYVRLVDVQLPCLHAIPRERSSRYLSPEQVNGGTIDARSDIYALGILAYEMLTGRVPFDRPKQINTEMAHVSEQVPPMAASHVVVSNMTEAIVQKCLSKSPDDRYGSIDDLLRAIGVRNAMSGF